MHIHMKNHWILSYHRELNVYYDLARDIALIGIVWSIEAGSSPEDDINRIPVGLSAEQTMKYVLQCEEKWCGRYTVISQGHILTDTGALMGVFYSEGYVSNNLNLIAEALELPEKEFIGSEKLKWLPGPLTQYPQIKRLLPSQVLHYEGNTVDGRMLLPPQTPSFLSDEDRIKFFIDVFFVSLTNMYRQLHDYNFFVTLTGGHDSRVVLSLMEKAGLPYECFGLEYDGIAESDITIPKQLCDRLKRNYSYIHRKQDHFKPELLEEYKKHTSGLIEDQDMYHYAYQEYQEAAEKAHKAAFLRGCEWEVAVDYLTYIQDTIDEKTLLVEYGIEPDSVAAQSIRAYIEWTQKNPQPSISLGNRYYWEQRVGSWLSGIEQGFDLLDNAISLQSCNNRRLLAILLGFERKDRIRKLHQDRIVSAACPAICDIPYGKAEASAAEKMHMYGEKLQRAFNRMKTIGFTKTMKIIIERIKRSAG